MKKFLILPLIILLSACGPEPVRRLIPIDTTYHGTTNTRNVSVTYNEAVLTRLEKLDVSAKQSSKKATAENRPSSLPLKEMLATTIKEQITNQNPSGTPVDIHVDITNLQLASAMATILIGGMDQLSGIVEIKNHDSGEVISQFSVDVLDSNGGLLGLAIRGGGVREKLAVKFSDFINTELNPDTSKSR